MSQLLKLSESLSRWWGAIKKQKTPKHQHDTESRKSIEKTKGGKSCLTGLEQNPGEKHLVGSKQ